MYIYDNATLVYEEEVNNASQISTSLRILHVYFVAFIINNCQINKCFTGFTFHLHFSRNKAWCCKKLFRNLRRKKIRFYWINGQSVFSWKDIKIWRENHSNSDLDKHPISRVTGFNGNASINHFNELWT